MGKHRGEFREVTSELKSTEGDSFAKREVRGKGSQAELL